VLPLPFTWPVAIPFWVAGFWAFAAELHLLRRSRRDGIRPTPLDAGSRRVIGLAGAAGLCGAFFAGGLLPSSAIAAMRLPVYITGVMAILAGGLLRRHCFAMLGSRFTPVVKATRDQTVVERGAYKYVRHPSYAAGLLLYGGIGLSLGNWVSLVSAVTPLALAYCYRIAVEERALLQAIGVPYADYMKRTRRLIPFVL
jgi:protein-S-isoprenylcysteine O-methyltransferase Ste14